MDNTSPRTCMPGIKILVIATIAAAVISILAVRLLNSRSAGSQAATDTSQRTTTVQLTGTAGAQLQALTFAGASESPSPGSFPPRLPNPASHGGNPERPT